MDIYQAMETRWSVRAFLPDPVPEEALSRVLRAAQVAPSWKNKQAWEIIVIRDRERLETLGRLLRGNPHRMDYRTLPMMLALAMDPTLIDEREGKPYYLVDAGIFGEHIVLAAQAEGLGTCWIGWFDEEPIARLLKIPPPYRLVMLTPLGYPAEERKIRPRREISDFVHAEHW